MPRRVHRPSIIIVYAGIGASEPVDSASLPSNNGAEGGSHAKTWSALKQLILIAKAHFLRSSLLIMHYTKNWGEYVFEASLH